jgi:hypothetical protein
LSPIDRALAVLDQTRPPEKCLGTVRPVRARRTASTASVFTEAPGHEADDASAAAQPSDRRTSSAPSPGRSGAGGAPASGHSPLPGDRTHLGSRCCSRNWLALLAVSNGGDEVTHSTRFRRREGLGDGLTKGMQLLALRGQVLAGTCRVLGLGERGGGWNSDDGSDGCSNGEAMGHQDCLPISCTWQSTGHCPRGRLLAEGRSRPEIRGAADRSTGRSSPARRVVGDGGGPPDKEDAADEEPTDT